MEQSNLQRYGCALTISLVSGFGAPAPVWAVDLYVDQGHPAASDGNAGTEAEPLRTIAAACERVEPGDRVIVKGGEDAADPDAIYDASGQTGLPLRQVGEPDALITFTTAPDHTVIIQGDGTGYGIDLDDASHHVIHGFIFRNFGKAAEGWAAKTNILIEACEFTQTTTCGLRIRNAVAFTMRDCLVHRCFEAGISIRDSRNVRLENVESSYNDDGLGVSGDGDGFHALYVDDLALVGCAARGNSEDGFDLTSNGTMVNCIASGHPSCNIKLFRRSGDHYAPKRMEIVNSIIFGAGEAGIKASVGAELHLINSVVYGNGEEGVALRDPGGIISEPIHSTVSNCLVVDNGTYAIRVNGPELNVVDADHNLYFSNPSGVLQLASDTHRIDGVDPLLVNPGGGDFHVAPGSVAIDGGVMAALPSDVLDLDGDDDHGEPIPMDLDGAVRTLNIAPDLGAYERVPAIDGDLDQDGDVDAADLAAFQACATGPGVPYEPGSLDPACLGSGGQAGTVPADLDTDGDIDQADFGLLQRCLSGAYEAVDPLCLGE